MLILCISHIEVIEIIQETDAGVLFSWQNKQKQTRKKQHTANEAVYCKSMIWCLPNHGKQQTELDVLINGIHTWKRIENSANIKRTGGAENRGR